ASLHGDPWRVRGYRERHQDHNWSSSFPGQPDDSELREGGGRKTDHPDYRGLQHRQHSGFNYPSDDLQPAIQLGWWDATDVHRHWPIRELCCCRDAIGDRHVEWDTYCPRQQWRLASGG